MRTPTQTSQKMQPMFFQGITGQGLSDTNCYSLFILHVCTQACATVTESRETYCGGEMLSCPIQIEA